MRLVGIIFLVVGTSFIEAVFDLEPESSSDKLLSDRLSPSLFVGCFIFVLIKQAPWQTTMVWTADKPKLWPKAEQQ